MYTETTNALPNSIFHYVFYIDNAGPSAAADVVVTDVLPANLLFERLDALGGFLTCTTPAVGENGTVTCTAASFPASRSGLFLLTVRVAPNATSGTVTNSITVTSSTVDPDLGDRTASATPVTLVPPATGERHLDPTATMHQMTPQVATTSQNALAVWREGSFNFIPPDRSGAIRGALFRPDTPGETLIEFAPAEQGTNAMYPVVAAAGDRYLVVWREIKSGQGRILARRLRTDGTFLDTQPLVLESGVALTCCTDAGDPRPAVASDGRDFYVAWVTADSRVRGIVVPAQGAVIGQPLLISRDEESGTRGRFDLEVVRTPALYMVIWLERLPASGGPFQRPDGMRYARVTTGGVLLDSLASIAFSGPDAGSITATGSSEGAVITANYFYESADISSPGLECVGVLLMSTTGEPHGGWRQYCEDLIWFKNPTLHSKILPVAKGFLLVQPGRRYGTYALERPIRTVAADHTLMSISEPKVLESVLVREVAIANWQGSALLVYNRTERDPGRASVVRTLAYVVPGSGGRKTRAVRH